MIGDQLLDVLDLHALRLAGADEIPDRRLRRLDGERCAGQCRMREQPVDRAFEIAPVRLDCARDVGGDRRRHEKLRLQFARRGDARLDDLDAERLVEAAHVDAEPAGQARAHALLEALEIARRAVGGNDDLPPRIDQRVERMAEFLLDRFALQKLHVVDDEHVDAAQSLLEGDRRLRLQRGHETVHEFFRRQIDDAARICAGLMGDRLQEVRLTQADRGVDVERVEQDRIAGFGARGAYRRRVEVGRGAGSTSRPGRR